MAKKILGDDPFGAPKQPETSAAKKGKGKAATKAKRAPSKKLEAPKAARKKDKSEVVAEVAAKTIVTEVAPSELPVELKVEHLNGHANGHAPVAPNPDATALARTESDAPTDAPPGSWRWWRARQLQLARAEEQSFLARPQGTVRMDRFGRDPQLAGRAEPIIDVLYRSWLRVSVRGLGHVPETGRGILVAKRRRNSTAGLPGLAMAPLHRFGFSSAWAATLDAAVIAHAIRTEHVAHREVRPLVKPARLYTPFVGNLIRRLGGVPADLHDFARLLDDDRLALAFVDDASPRADALDLSTIICLALVTGAPIIPVTLAVSEARPNLLLRRRRVTALHFGAPQYPGVEFGPEGAEDEALVARLAGELSAQLS